MPLLSQTGLKFTDAERDALTHRIQFGGDEVVKAKDGTGTCISIEGRFLLSTHLLVLILRSTSSSF